MNARGEPSEPPSGAPFFPGLQIHCGPPLATRKFPLNEMRTLYALELAKE